MCYAFAENHSFMKKVQKIFHSKNIQNFWEGERTLYRGPQHFMGGLGNPLETMPQKLQNLKKKIRKSLPSNALA